MLNGLFPSQVLVSFTGDEENDCAGVDQTIDFLQKENLFENLEIVIALDLTEEYFGLNHFTIENYFIEKEHGHTLLHFKGKRDLRNYLSTILESPKFVENAEPDESWQYEE